MAWYRWDGVGPAWYGWYGLVYFGIGGLGMYRIGTDMGLLTRVESDGIVGICSTRGEVVVVVGTGGEDGSTSRGARRTRRKWGDATRRDQSEERGSRAVRSSPIR